LNPSFACPSAYAGAASGFSCRFPAVGTVYLELFGVNPLARTAGPQGNYYPVSLGVSQAINLTSSLGANENKLTAWNNVFKPLRGEKATFKYELTSAGHVRLRLYTMSGALVKTFIDEDLPAGQGSMDWDGTNLAGNLVASGIYVLYLDAPGGKKVQKVIVVK
jgi:hypothetical protein